MLRHGIQYCRVPIIAIISNKAAAARGYVNDRRDRNESGDEHATVRTQFHYG